MDSVGDGDHLSTVLRNHKRNEHLFRVTIVMVCAGGKEVTMPRGPTFELIYYQQKMSGAKAERHDQDNHAGSSR